MGSGFKASAWPLLDPSARRSLLEEILIFNPELEVIGTPDYESPSEPLLLDTSSGETVTLLGDVVQTPDGSLAVTVFPGGVKTDPLPIIAIGLALLAVAVNL